MTDGRFLEGSTTANIQKAAGLPNITGRFGLFDNCGGNSFASTSNAVFFVSNGAKYSYAAHVGDGATSPMDWINFDASHASPIYGNSTTVQPNSYTVRYYIRAK